MESLKEGTKVKYYYAQCSTCLNKSRYERRKNNPEAYERLKERNRKKSKKQFEDRPEMFKRRMTKYIESGVMKNYNLKKYGITHIDYINLFNKQGGKCVICKIHRDKLNQDLCVDHCHKTGNVRGLLCNSCNTGIGLLKEDVQILLSAIEYVKRI